MTKHFVADRLLVDVIDYPSMWLIIRWCYWILIDFLLITHRLLVDYSSFITLHNFYSLLQISSIFLYYTFPRTNLRPEQFPIILIGKGEL